LYQALGTFGALLALLAVKLKSASLTQYDGGLYMKLSAYLFGALFLAGCASAQSGDSQPASATQDPQQAIEEAVQAQKKAASVGSEWRDTQSLIDKAREAAGKGDSTTALKLAAEAKFQGEQGYIQGTSQKDVGPRY